MEHRVPTSTKQPGSRVRAKQRVRCPGTTTKMAKCPARQSSGQTERRTGKNFDRKIRDRNIETRPFAETMSEILEREATFRPFFCPQCFCLKSSRKWQTFRDSGTKEAFFSCILCISWFPTSDMKIAL